MKKFSLKKITAAVSAAAMIATMGTSAFAEIDSNKSQNGTGISLKSDVSVIQAKDSENNYITGVYDVTVSFTTEQQQEIGVTLFAYVPQTQNPAPTLGTGYTDQTTTPIVGVDQKEMTGTEGSITFRVSANDSASIKMSEGQIGIVKVSGDKVDSPAVALFSIPVAPFDAVVVDANLSSTDEFDFGTEVAELKAAVLDRINNVTAFADAAKTGKSDIGTKKTSLDASKVTIQKKTSGDPIPYAKDLAGTFTVTIPATEFEFASVNASSLTDKNVSFDIVVKKDVWTVSNAALVDGNNLTAEVPTAVDDAFVAELKKALKDKKVALTGEGNKLYEVSVNENWIDAGTVGTDNKTVTFKITVPIGEHGNDNVTAKVEEAKEFNVVYTLTDLTKIIDPATLTLTYDGNALTADSTGAYAVEVEKGTEDPTAKAVIGLKNKKDQVAEVDTAYTLSAWTSEPTYAKDTPGVYTFTTTITPAEDYSLDGGAATKVVTLKVTVKDGESIIIGDINHNGSVDGVDYSIFKNHITGISEYTPLKDSNSYNYKAADINGSGTVDGVDYSIFKNHITGISENANIGKTVNK